MQTLGFNTSAKYVFSKTQLYALVFSALIYSAFALQFSESTYLLTIYAINTIYILAGIIRLYLFFSPKPKNDVGVFTPHKLPIYSILVPLFNEAKVVKALVKHLAQLHYPQTKLQILMICEATDRKTITAVRRAIHGQRQFTLVIVPIGHPQTKPRACNFALKLVKGSFVTIYDAEDRPELNQLQTVLAKFTRQDQMLYVSKQAWRFIIARKVGSHRCLA